MLVQCLYLNKKAVKIVAQRGKNVVLSTVITCNKHYIRWRLCNHSRDTLRGGFHPLPTFYFFIMYEESTETCQHRM